MKNLIKTAIKVTVLASLFSACGVVNSNNEDDVAEGTTPQTQGGDTKTTTMQNPPLDKKENLLSDVSSALNGVGVSESITSEIVAAGRLAVAGMELTGLTSGTLDALFKAVYSKLGELVESQKMVNENEQDLKTKAMNAIAELAVKEYTESDLTSAKETVTKVVDAIMLAVKGKTSDETNQTISGVVSKLANVCFNTGDSCTKEIAMSIVANLSSIPQDDVLVIKDAVAAMAKTLVKEALLKAERDSTDGVVLTPDVVTNGVMVDVKTAASQLPDSETVVASVQTEVDESVAMTSAYGALSNRNLERLKKGEFDSNNDSCEKVNVYCYLAYQDLSNLALNQPLVFTDLSKTNLTGSNLTNGFVFVDLSNSIVSGVIIDSNYQKIALEGVNLTGTYFDTFDETLNQESNKSDANFNTY